MKKILALFALSTALWGEAREVDTLYLLQDMGECDALAEVILKADENHDNFAILTGGTASALFKSNLKLQSHLITLDSLGLQEKVDRDWKREGTLSEKSIQTVKDHLHPKKVVSGVAYEFHGQLLKVFEKEGATTYAYWDNFQAEGTDPYFQTAKKVATLAQHLLVPSRSFLEIYPGAKVVGQPGLENECRPLEKPEKPLPFDVSHSLIVWVGGYGEAYNEALEQFLQGASKLPSTIILSYHPRYEGKAEKEMLQKYPASNVFFLDPSWNLSTRDVVAHADVIICHQSTAGIKAAMAGKKVIYFTPKNQTYTNKAIEMHLVPQVSTMKELEEKLQDHTTPTVDFLEALAIPRGGANRIYQILHGK